MLERARILAFVGLLLTPGSGFPAGEAPAAPALPREFVMAYSPRAVNLDPLHTFTSMESQFFTAIYEGLLVSHPLTLEPVPGVAERWESSEKGKIYRFFLRPDALFSNGEPVRAKDFVDSWLRMIDPSQNAEYSFLFDVIKGAHAYRTGGI
jgi:oligopeptide transport system substrate-binding protein